MAQGSAQVDVFTTVGKQQVAKLVVGVSANAFKYIALGIGNTADAAVDDTTLSSETSAAGLARVLITPTQTGTVASWSNTFTNASGSTVVLTECGIFDAASAGNLLRHITFGTSNTISVVNGGSVKIVINQTVT